MAQNSKMSKYKKPLRYYFGLAFLVLKRFPNCKCRWGARDKFIIWEYTYVSEITHKSYTLCLNYEVCFDPRIWIVEPDFSKISPKQLKHVYSQYANCLCLFHPTQAPWSIKNDIAPTLITWAFLWIEFYEAWKITDIWYGAEAKHDTTSDCVNTSTEALTHKTRNKHKPIYLKDYPIRY